ncbi:hypothetical protein AB0I81_55010 [Nonomuraea sp. NPDC050404]|uniref:hypothetical protein n=1 Tax=Nonomuraea sp. NPDC050404 TaxID=3155783 RepID=UPI0033D00AAA
MAIMLSPELDATLELAGLWFPNVNEDEIEADSRAARIVAAGTAQAGADADANVQGATQVYRGDSATALQGSWQANDNTSGHLAQATAAVKAAPAVLDGLSTVVTATKVATGTLAAVGTVRLLQAVLAGGPMAGLSSTAVLLGIRRAGTKIFRQAAEGSGRKLAPELAGRSTQPLRNILGNLKLPGAPGNPALAGIPGGRTSLSGVGNGKTGLDRFPGIAQMARGGRGGGRGRNDSNANLSPEEQAAKDAKESGQPYDRSIFNRAAAKERQAEKFEGDRNKQKRGRK